MADPKKKVPLWLAWATQTYLDILQSLGQQQCLNIKHIMLGVPVSSKERPQVLSAAGRWDKEPIWTARKLMVNMVNLGLFPNEIAPPFKLLHHNPIYYGLFIYTIYMQIYTLLVGIILQLPERFWA